MILYQHRTNNKFIKENSKISQLNLIKKIDFLFKKYIIEKENHPSYFLIYYLELFNLIESSDLDLDLKEYFKTALEDLKNEINYEEVKISAFLYPKTIKIMKENFNLDYFNELGADFEMRFPDSLIEIKREFESYKILSNLYYQDQFDFKSFWYNQKYLYLKKYLVKYISDSFNLHLETYQNYSLFSVRNENTIFVFYNYDLFQK